MSDQETMTLCKAVYERLGWDEADFRYVEYKLSQSDSYDKAVLKYMPRVENEQIWSGARFTPLYSLEYVLDRLPQGEIRNRNGKYTAWQNNDKGIAPTEGNTALQAALRLVLALHDAGVLKS